MAVDQSEKQVRVVGYAPPTAAPTTSREDPASDDDAASDADENDDFGDEGTDVEDEGIDTLMEAFPDDETDIDLTHLRITTTKGLNLPRFADTLVRLCLRQNLIHSIREADFAPLQKLTDLDLYDNQIKRVNGLSECKNLECVSVRVGTLTVQSTRLVVQQHPAAT